MTDIPPGGVVLTAQQVATLRGYLARAHDWDADHQARDNARGELCGHLEAILDAAQETQ